MERYGVCLIESLEVNKWKKRKGVWFIAHSDQQTIAMSVGESRETTL